MRISDWSSDVCSSDLSSDVPAGVINVLTGKQAELAPWLADHMDVNAIDMAGADDGLRVRIEQGAVHNVKRLIGTDGDPDGQSTEGRRGGKGGDSTCRSRGWPDT